MKGVFVLVKLIRIFIRRAKVFIETIAQGEMVLFLCLEKKGGFLVNFGPKSRFGDMLVSSFTGFYLPLRFEISFRGLPLSGVPP